MSERLHKRLARAGVASRRAAEAMISAGRVSVNGVTAILGQSVTDADDVRVDGQLIELERAPARTFALYKPTGYVTTASDEYGRRNVLDAMPALPGLHPVGRLDRDSEGLLILTTDGDLTLQLTHPRYGHEKAYRAWTDGDHDPTPDELDALTEGIDLSDGPARAISASPATGGAFLVLGEGRKRQVRRMLAAIGHPVVRLMRYRTGGLWIGNLDVGEYRELGPEDMADLLRPNGAGSPNWDRNWELMQRRWG
ncbi:pseudouridine synthase [Deinococcus sp.]|uniref:pseudouridine synthase n=1 Tax=Deinococcus sp. TaxID=47478 RepID=UPI002869D0B7|nr:pseudouridine synthase [Deinococcus sp.]